MSLKNSFAGVCVHSSSGRVCTILQNLKTKYSLSLDLALRHLVPFNADHSLLSGPTRCLIETQLACPDAGHQQPITGS